MSEAALAPTPALLRNLGKFRISEQVVIVHPEIVQAILSECAVVRCELSYETMCFEYVAVSPHFEDCANFQAPEYEALMERVNEGPDEGKVLFKGFRRNNQP